MKTGLPQFYSNTSTQVRLHNGKIMDILTWEIKNETDFYFRLFELKKGVINRDAYFQAADYYSEFICSTSAYFTSVKGEIILVGDELEDDVFRAMSMSNNVRGFVYNLGFGGLIFKERGLMHSDLIIGLEKVYKEESLCDYNIIDFLLGKKEQEDIGFPDKEMLEKWQKEIVLESQHN